MFEKLEDYLEEISHFLAGRLEREEILSEIKSHILEKAEQEHGAVTDASLAAVIAAYGPARRVAEKYLDGREIIAPSLQRYLFRYTSFLFLIHTLITAVAVLFTKSILVFPFLFVPRMSVFEALAYLPTAFLFDLGLVTLILHFISRSKREVHLPWLKLAVDLDEMKRPKKRILSVLGFGALSAGAGLALYLYIRYRTIFLIRLNFRDFEPLFNPPAGTWFSLAVIALLAVGAIAMFIKFFIASPIVDVVKNGIILVIFGLLLSARLDDAFVVAPSAKALLSIKYTLTVVLVLISVGVIVDFIKALVRLGRKTPARR